MSDQSRRSSFLVSPSKECYLLSIWMSHCCHRTTEGNEFCIICKRLAFLRIFSRLQVIQNKRPGVRRRHMWQLDERIISYCNHENFWINSYFRNHINKKGTIYIIFWKWFNLLSVSGATQQTMLTTPGKVMKVQ